MVYSMIIATQNQWTMGCMEVEDYHTAVVSSSSALEYLGIIERTQTNSSSSSSSPPTYDPCMLLTATDETKDQETAGHFVYSHGIPLPPTVTDLETIAPILIFNAALAHQQFARHCNDKNLSIKYLRRAYQLYSLAYEVPGLDENPLFQFAVINNAAVIARQLDNNMESWNETMEYLLSLYMALMDRGCTSMTRRVRGFLANAVPSSPVAHVA